MSTKSWAIQFFVLSNARPTGYDKEIRRYTCEATLAVPFDSSESGQVYEVSVPYVSQIVSGGDQIVEVSISPFDIMGVGAAASAHQTSLEAAAPAEPVTVPNTASGMPAVELQASTEEQTPAQPVDDGSALQDPEPVVEEAIDPSFDCAKAGTLQEQLICSDASLATLDRYMADSYKVALGSSFDKSELTGQQRAWIRNVRNNCQDTACLTEAYQERLNELAR